MSSGGLGRRDVAMSSVLFAVSTASLFLVDLVAAGADSDEVATWATIKALIFIGSGFCLVGADQAVLRAEIRFDEYRRGVVRQSLMLAPIVAAVGIVAGGFRAALLGASGAFMLSILASVSGFYRSRFAITRAHLAFQAWKLLLLVGVGLVLLLDLDRIPEVAVIVLAIWVIVILRRPPIDQASSDTEFKDLGPVGRRFWLAALVASGMQYVDQLLLNLAGETNASAEYFRYVVTFLSFATVFTALVAQIGNPWVRQNLARLRQLYRPVSLIWIGVSAAATAVSVGVGLVLNGVVDLIPRTDIVLLALVASLAFVRLLYLLPSAVVGVVSSRAQLSKLLIGTSLSLLLFATGFLVLILAGVEAVFAVAVAALTSSILRLLVATTVASSVLRTDGKLEMVL